MARDILQYIQVGVADEWIRSLEIGGESSLDVMLACLLFSLPNLNALKLNMRFEDRRTQTSDTLQNFLRSNSSSLLSLTNQQLKRITLFNDYDPGRDEQQPRFFDFQWLFYLPRIDMI